MALLIEKKCPQPFQVRALVLTVERALERKFRPELYSPRITNGDYVSVSGACDVRLDGSEVRVIENIEGLATQLQTDAFPNVDSLEQ